MKQTYLTLITQLNIFSIRQLYIVFVGITLSSCTQWLDVVPDDRIMEDKLFEDVDGYYSAINGVYIELASESLYGATLSGELSDIMAQYYNTKISDRHRWNSLAKNNSQAKLNVTDKIWSKAYNLIGNINIIIEHCNADNILSVKDKNIILAECYGLRALLHFELYRIFGSFYHDKTDNKIMPYKTSSEIKVLPFISSKKILINIIGDLRMGEQILQKHEPLVTGEQGGNYLSVKYKHRQLRMNLFAIKSLIARVLLYKGDKKGAYKCVEKIIDDATRLFPFATAKDVIGDGNATSNRVFSSELIFSVYNSKRTSDLYNNLFSYRLPLDKVLCMNTSGYLSLFSEESDIRTNQWQAHSNIEGDIAYFLIKYSPVADAYINSLVPVIRLSELYLIASETAPTDELALKYLNKLRKARNVTSISHNIRNNIELGYVREFVGEGQLFWFYKRKDSREIPVRYKSNMPKVKMDREDYLFEIPNSEKEHRL